jgi:WhiB family redox-sensing transcriptional regulator
VSGDWQDRAACRGTDIRVFFPERGEARGANAEARAICDECPVTAPCLEDALGRPVQIGFQGGRTARERNLILLDRAEAGR